MILKCICSNEYQDKEHGKGYRVFNSTKEGYRCTTCKREIQAGSVKKDDKEKEDKK